MYEERVDNQSHRGLTLKNCNSLLGKEQKHNFYELVRGLGFQEGVKRVVRGVEYEFDLGSFPELKIPQGVHVSAKLKIFKSFESGKEQNVLKELFEDDESLNEIDF